MRERERSKGLEGQRAVTVHPYRAYGPCGELWSHCRAVSRRGTWFCLSIERVMHRGFGENSHRERVTHIPQVRHIVTQPKLSSTRGEKSLFRGPAWVFLAEVSCCDMSIISQKTKDCERVATMK